MIEAGQADLAPRSSQRSFVDLGGKAGREILQELAGSLLQKFPQQSSYK